MCLIGISFLVLVCWLVGWLVGWLVVVVVMAMEIDGVLRRGRTQIAALQQALESLENGLGTLNDVENARDLLMGLNEIISNCKVCQPRTASHDARIRNMEDEYVILEASIDKQRNILDRKSKEVQERQALFQRLPGKNAGGGGGKGSGGDDVAIDIGDHGLTQREAASLGRSTHMVDEMTEIGRNALASLYDQRMTLVGARQRLANIASTLGLSNDLIRMIETRRWQDKWLVYGGMVFTLVILFLLYYYVRG